MPAHGIQGMALTIIKAVVAHLDNLSFCIDFAKVKKRGHSLELEF